MFEIQHLKSHSILKNFHKSRMIIKIWSAIEFLSGESVNSELRLVEGTDIDSLSKAAGVSTVQIHGKEISNITKDRQMGKPPDLQIVT